MSPTDRGRERPWVPASQMLLGYPSGISERCNLDSIMMPGPLEAEGCGHELSGDRKLMSVPENVVAGLGFGLNKSAPCSGHCPKAARPGSHPQMTDQGKCVSSSQMLGGQRDSDVTSETKARWALSRWEPSCPQHLPEPCLFAPRHLETGYPGSMTFMCM